MNNRTELAAAARLTSSLSPNAAVGAAVAAPVIPEHAPSIPRATPPAAVAPLGLAADGAGGLGFRLGFGLGEGEGLWFWEGLRLRDWSWVWLGSGFGDGQDVCVDVSRENGLICEGLGRTLGSEAKKLQC